MLHTVSVLLLCALLIINISPPICIHNCTLYVVYIRSLFSILQLLRCRQSSLKEVKPTESIPATTAAVNNTSNVDVIPPLQPSPARKVGIPPHKSASVHAFSGAKPPVLKTVRTLCILHSYPCNYSNIAVTCNNEP